MAKPAQAAESAQLASSARDHLTFQPASSTCAGGPTRRSFFWPNRRSSQPGPASNVAQFACTLTQPARSPPPCLAQPALHARPAS